MANPLTLNFDQLSAADLPRVGGKGANLGEMTRAGFPVPPGFCVTTDAFQQFMVASQAADELYPALEALAADDVEGVRRVGQQVRERLRVAPIPSPVAEAFVAAWETQGTEHPYAVRSSATAEDLPDASFAGQQDTYLNVIGRDAHVGCPSKLLDLPFHRPGYPLPGTEWLFTPGGSAIGGRTAYDFAPNFRHPFHG